MKKFATSLRSKLILVSVIIPTRNAEFGIVRCLEQIKHQDYPHRLLEVIVADGGSVDRTALLAEEAELGQIALKVLRLSAMGRAYGLNAAIREARGGVVCRLDVRTYLEPDYIRRCVETLNVTGAANVGGVQVPLGRTVKQRSIGWAISHPFGAGNAKFKTAKRSDWVDSVYLGCFRRDVFEVAGLFDETGVLLSEDSDMNERIRMAGYGIYLNADIRVGYEPRGTLRGLGKLYYRYGLARVGNMKKNRQLTSWRQVPAPGLTAVLVSFPIVGILQYEIWVIWMVVLASYLVMDLAFSLWIAARKCSLRSALVLVLAFPVMHLTWGAGFWRGLFSSRQGDDKVIV